MALDHDGKRDIASLDAHHIPKDDEFAQIRRNCYEGEAVMAVVGDNMPKFEALTIPDSEYRCVVHKDDLIWKDIKYTFNSGTVLGVRVFICPKCNRIFVKERLAKRIRNVLTDAGVECRIYPLALSGRYLRSLTHVHDKSTTADVPQAKAEPIRRSAPKNLTSDYIVENGKRLGYSYEIDQYCPQLTEEDIVVVSDSLYCPLKGHVSTVLPALIHVQEKKEGRKAYLFLLGHCEQCRKYYMNRMDHDAMRHLGRAEVDIRMDREDADAFITSGHEFNGERDHLKDVEGAIEEEEASIKANSGYISQYALLPTGGYDDGGLAYQKHQSKIRYQPRLVELAGYKPRPYLFRVDIAHGGRIESYYIGKEDVILNGRQWVISRESEFGRTLINYQTIKVKKDGREYSITRSREFDIDDKMLYGYRDLRTCEDAIFKSGLTDPFLVRVLKTRRRQHQLTDIFVTIQANQNSIVNEDLRANVIVQGCAGSGKTMVLLHRLSALQYRERNFDFSNDALILTPNEQFAFHIRGIAEDLQIGNIARTSIEQYYLDVLSEYSSAFQLKKTELASEMDVRSQAFVDHIYSDAFRAELAAAYDAVIAERNGLAEKLRQLAEAMGEPAPKIDLSDDPKVELQLRTNAEALRHRIEGREAALSAVLEDLERLQARRRQLTEDVNELAQRLSAALDESATSVRLKIELYRKRRQLVISRLEERIAALRAEQSRVQANMEPMEAQERQQRQERKQYLQEQIKALTRSITEMLDGMRSDVNSKIEAYRTQKQRDISALEARLEALKAEEERAQGGILAFLRRGRLDELAANMRSVRRKLEQERASLEEEERVFRSLEEGADANAFIAWLYRVYEIIPNVWEEIVRYTSLRDKRNEVAYELNRTDALIETVDERKAELDRCEADMRGAQAVLDREKAELQALAPTLTAPPAGTNDAELIAWFIAVMAIIPEVREEVQRCTELRDEFKRETDRANALAVRIDAAEAEVAEKRKELYPAEVKQEMVKLCGKIETYSVLQTFRSVYERAVAGFRAENDIGEIAGKYHRCELYAMLLFALRFFGHAAGGYSFICVDEGQDLALNEYRLLYELNGRNVVFNVFGDTHQLMKRGRGISDWTALQNEFGAKLFTLNENYRNTNQITSFCNTSFGMNVTQTGVDGPNVRKIPRRELEGELAALDIGSERLAILVPRAVQKKQYLDQQLLPTAIAEAVGERMERGCIALMYVDEVKGIEFDKVYVASDGMSANERYIAFTRALSELVLVSDGDKPEAQAVQR